MLSRFVRIQLLVFFVVTIVGITYTGLNYIGVSRLFGYGYYQVVAKFSDSGGIFSNAEVTYRGVTVGRVEKIRLVDGGIAVELLIENGVRIPAKVRAEVHNRSAVGEQYVDLLPQREGGPYLHHGSVIPRSRTGIPTEVTALLTNLNELVNSVPQDDLNTVIDELHKAFGGTGPDLQRLLDSGDRLLTQADANLPQTRRLIEDGETVLRTQVESGDAIRSFADDLASLTDQLRESDTDLRQTLDHGAGASVQLTDLVNRLDSTLPVLLSNLITTGQVVEARLPGVEQILVTYPIVVAASYTVVPGDGTAHFGLVANVNAPPPCTDGYEKTSRRYPQNVSDTTATKNADCADSNPNIAVRGARHAPEAPPVPDGGNPGGSAEGERSPETNEDSGDTYLAGYDPATGRVVGPEGEPYVIGSTGGQQRRMGEDSWKWLLLHPLGR